jgi:ATP-dependent DNA helicase 2 subunit 2
VIIILDVGKNTLEKSGKNGLTFFERAKQCATKIILRKIFSSPQDEIGCITFGSLESVNGLNQSFGEFDNIVEMGGLECSTFDLLRKLEKVEAATEDYDCDWLRALLVAINYVEKETAAKNFTNIRIVLLTNFLKETDDADDDVASNYIRENGIELIGVSDTVQYEDTERLSGCHFTQSGEKNEFQAKSEEIFNKMTEKLENSILCHIDHVESQLVHFQRRTKKPFPWNVALTIGNDFRINVSAYVHVKNEPFFESFKTECFEPNTHTKMETHFMRNNEEIEKPDEQDLISAYMYGKEICPIDEDMRYDGGKKCLSVLAFVKINEIPSKYYKGEGSHAVVPQKGFEKSSRLFASLVHTMHAHQYAMLARKIYRDNTKPHFVILLPQVTENEALFLTMIEMPFYQDIIFTQFPPLKSEKNKTSDEQAAAIDDLIANMNLMKAIDDESGVNELKVDLNPIQQHMCNAVAYRALHPTDPLPPFDDELMKLFDVPEKIKKQIQASCEKLEELFKLEVVRDREKKPFGQKARKIDADGDTPMESEDQQTEASNRNNITRVGTVTPAEDFLYLTKFGLERFGNLCDQIEQVIFNFIFKVTIDFSDKLKETILAYREMAKIHSPFQYNKWIKEFKEEMLKQNKVEDFEKIVVAEGFGPISINESPISTLTIEEQLQFYEIISKDSSSRTVLGTADEEDDLETLLG